MRTSPETIAQFEQPANTLEKYSSLNVIVFATETHKMK
jgi:hypothetical protein